jgi:hypothetical protein
VGHQLGVVGVVLHHEHAQARERLELMAGRWGLPTHPVSSAAVLIYETTVARSGTSAIWTPPSRCYPPVHLCEVLPPL